MSPKVSNLYMQVTENHMRFTEKITLKFLNEIMGKRNIFVKPNIVSDKLYPITTHPDVLRYVLKNIPESCKVTIADAPENVKKAKKIIKNHPLAKVCKQLDYRLENLYDLGYEEVETKTGLKLNISKLALECDYMISLPLMRKHSIKGVGISGALMNNFSLLSERDRKMFSSSQTVRRLVGKKRDINLAIAEINLIRKPNLFIVDMIDTMTRSKDETRIGVMLAGKDPVALDCMGFELLKKVDPWLRKKEPENIKSIRYAIDLGVGTKKFKRVQIKD